MKEEIYYCDGCKIQVGSWRELSTIRITVDDSTFIIGKTLKEWKDRCQVCKQDIFRHLNVTDSPSQ